MPYCLISYNGGGSMVFQGDIGEAMAFVHRLCKNSEPNDYLKTKQFDVISMTDSTVKTAYKEHAVDWEPRFNTVVYGAMKDVLLMYATNTQHAEQATPQSSDMVNNPKHYKLPGLDIEWIDVKHSLFQTIPSEIDPEIVSHWSEVMNYLARMWQKNGMEDAHKAKFYLDRLIELS